MFCESALSARASSLLNFSSSARFCYAKAHRSATPQAVVDTLTWIQSHYNFNISSLVSDLGGEMTGAVVKNYLRDRGILHFFSLDPKVKTAIVERVISFVCSALARRHISHHRLSFRSLKGRIFKQFAAKGSFDLRTDLQPVVDGLNATYNRSLPPRTAPKDVEGEDKIAQVYAHLYGQRWFRNRHMRFKLERGWFLPKIPKIGCFLPK